MPFANVLAEDIWKAKYRYKPAEGPGDEDFAATVTRVSAAVAEAEAAECRAYWKDRFAEALEGEPDSVVVWTPGDAGPDPSFKIDRLESAIRRFYEPDARFGIIEVWRRKAAPTAGPTLATRRTALPRIGG